jgi:hypothetical protein
VLLGLVLHLPPIDFGAEVEAGCTALRWDGDGGAAVVELTIPRSPAMASPLLLRVDFGELCAVVWYDREAFLVPFMLVPLSSPLPDLDVRHLGVALLPLMLMVEFLVLVADSLCWRIRNLQACDDVGGAGGALAWFFWLLFFGSEAGDGGRLSFVPLFCESVGSFGSIPDGDGGLVFWSPVVWQPTEAVSSSPCLHSQVADARSTTMVWCGGGGRPWIMWRQQGLKPPVRGEDGVGSASGRSPTGGFSDGLESFRVLGFAVVNSKFSRVCVVKGWRCTMLNP